jgi:hypothetical protein
MKKIWSFGLLFLIVTAPLQAQSGLQRAKAQLPKDAARMLEQTVLAAQKKGLPTEPLIDKALEGSAKRIPPSVILNAVRQRADMLARADAALRPFGKPALADVTSTADALQRGVSVDIVKRVRSGRRNGEPVGMALHTVADLMDRKVPANVALDVISSWRERGGKNEELRELPAAVEKLIRQGVSPSAAGRSVARVPTQSNRPTAPPGAAPASGSGGSGSGKPAGSSSGSGGGNTISGGKTPAGNSAIGGGKGQGPQKPIEPPGQSKGKKKN